MAAVDSPLRRLEQTLEGLRRSALETARLYERRAQLLAGPSQVDQQLSAKRWFGVADRAADLQDMLRSIDRRSLAGSGVVDISDAGLGHPAYRRHRVAADALDHLQAVRLDLDLLEGPLGGPSVVELTLVRQEIEHAAGWVRGLATD